LSFIVFRVVAWAGIDYLPIIKNGCLTSTRIIEEKEVSLAYFRPNVIKVFVDGKKEVIARKAV
jgi:hypothetical protein